MIFARSIAGGPTALGLAAAAMVMSLAMLRMVVTFSPQIDWLLEVREGRPITELGPMGLAVTDLLMVLALVLGVADAMVRGRRVRGWLVGLWAAGFAAAMLHAWRDPESLRLAGSWTAAMACGVTAAHVADEPLVRRAMVAGFVALIVPLTMQAVYQVAVEQPATVRYYEQQKREGRLPADAAADVRKFEQRLHQAEATGRTGFSNVLGTVMGALSLVAVGAAAEAWRRRMAERGARPWALTALAAAGVLVLALTFSKGAVLSFAVALAVMVVVTVMRRRGGGVRRGVVVAMVVAAVALPIAAVIVRGLVGVPESAAGERSLLFRYHYGQAAARMIAEHPLMGVSPGGFADRYLVLKNSVNPEDVSDPHNVFAAWVTALGVGGWAWVAAAVVLLVRAAGAVTTGRVNATREFAAAERWGLAATVAGVVFVAQLAVEFERYVWPEGYVMWLAGAGLWTLTAAALMRTGVLEGPTARLGVLGGALVALTHGQIEMSLTNAMSAPLLLTMLGVAAARGEAAEHAGGAAWRRTAVLWLLGAAVVVMLGVQAARTAQRERLLVALATGEYPLGADAHALPQVLTTDTPLARTLSTLLLERAAEAQRAGDAAAARDTHLRRAVEACGMAGPAQRDRLRAATLEHAAQRLGDRTLLEPAAEAAEAALAADPYGVAAHLYAADLAFEAGRTDRAARLYAEALRLSAASYLDPHRQLTDTDARRAKERSRR